MRVALLMIAIFALSMLVIPMIALDLGAPAEQSQIPTHVPAQVEQVPEVSEEEIFAPNKPPKEPVIPEIVEPEESDSEGDGETERFLGELIGVSSFNVLDESTGEVITVPVRDYIRGAVAAEMPASFHSAAMKAQAVAAHTYALYNYQLHQQTPDPVLKGADFSADPSNMKVYITEETAREFYGAKADEYWAKICEAADSVSDMVLAYQGEPIVAAYHAISSGTTEDASYLWPGDAPYLVAAPSDGDLLAPGFETEETFTAAAFKTAFQAEYPTMEFDDDSSLWIGEVQRSPSGYVTEIEIGGVSLHGKDVRRVLDLRSHSFDVLEDDRGFTFLVFGYGHGVGLSQYGADFMARQGATYEEILENYYTGATLMQLA